MTEKLDIRRSAAGELVITAARHELVATEADLRLQAALMAEGDTLTLQAPTCSLVIGRSQLWQLLFQLDRVVPAEPAAPGS